MTRTFNPAVDEPIRELTKDELATVPEMKSCELSLNEMTPLDPKDLEVVAGGMVVYSEILCIVAGHLA
jgi:hypothetical protein